MSGRLSKTPYPDDRMVDVFHVREEGNTLVLTVADGNVQTEDPPGSNQWRRSREGDVLAWAVDTWQGRIPGSNGYWETFAKNGMLRVYNPNYQPGGPTGQAVRGFLYWDVPNE